MNKNRRKFLRGLGLASAATLLKPDLSIYAGPNNTADIQKENEPKAEPNAAQKKWMNLNFGMFIHFGINTFYDKEWSDGTLDVSGFNPTNLDTDEWCKTAKEAGMKYVVLVTKHHDGFCNWPSQYTDYSVKSSPFNGDVVKRLVDSARKYDLEVGFYYSLWDRHEKTYKEDLSKYIQYMKNQLHELLTNYGPIVELWFDGFWKHQKHGWTKKDKFNPEYIPKGKSKEQWRDEKFIEAWRMEGAYKWQMDHLYQYVKSLQPNCMVSNNPTTSYPGVPLHPVDIRPGEKATKMTSDRKVWPFLGKNFYLPLQIETTMSVTGKEKFESGSWFWHEWDHSVLPKEKIKEYLKIAQKFDANLLLNVGPSTEGKLRPEDKKVLQNLNK